MKSKILKSGKAVFVDDEDYVLLEKHKWCTNSCNYVMRIEITNNKRKTITLHRLLLNAPTNMQVDHINGDRLDNRKINLRLCTRSQNCMNRKASIKNSSGYRGVRKNVNKWIARIEVNGKKMTLGSFETPEFAAKMYDKYAKSLYGEFARLNFD